MKILYVIIDLESGGAQEYLCRFLALLDRKRFDPGVLSLSGVSGPAAKKIRALGIPVYSVNMRNPVTFVFAVLKFIYLLAVLNPDVVHSWIYHANLASIAAKLLLRKKIIWSLRCSDAEFGYYGLGSVAAVKLCAFFSPLADMIIYNSEAGLKFHRLIGYRNAIQRVIGNGVDTRFFTPDSKSRENLREKYSIAPDALVVGMASRFDPMKDFKTLFAAFEKIHAKFSLAVLALCGSGMDEGNVRLLHMVSGIPAGSVKLLGFIEDMREFYRMLDVFALSSKSEGFPNVLTEAMSCAVPCVSSDAGDARVILGDTGETVPVGDAAALAAAVNKILEIPADKRKESGLKCRARAEENFPIEKFVNETEEYYTRF